MTASPRFPVGPQSAGGMCITVASLADLYWPFSDVIDRLVPTLRGSVIIVSPATPAASAAQDRSLFSSEGTGVMLNAEMCDRARLARDARFDGRFVTGGRTTRIY